METWIYEYSVQSNYVAKTELTGPTGLDCKIMKTWLSRLDICDKNAKTYEFIAITIWHGFTHKYLMSLTDNLMMHLAVTLHHSLWVVGSILVHTYR